MRVGPIAHGALLVAALGFAYQTWTRDKSEAPKVGTVTVWNESVSDFESFAFDGESKSVRVERRDDGGKPYFWGKVTRVEKKKKPRVPKKAPTDPAAGGQDDGHGHGPGAHGAPPTAPGGAREPGKPVPGKDAKPSPTPAKDATPATPTPATDAKKDAAKPPAGAGSGAKPAPQQARSPHHSGTDQPEKPAAPAAGSTPARPGDKPADKPAAGSTPAKPGDKPADKPTEPAADQSAGGEPPAGDEAGEGEEAAEGDPMDPDAEPVEPSTSKSKEFPIGRGGEDLIKNLAHLRALRDLGVLTDKQKEDYELTESKENLTVFFKGGKQRSLIIGARVFGGGDRYVMNADTGRGYVLSNSEIMRHIDGAETSLGIKNLHSFQEEPGEDKPDPHDPKAPKAKRDKYPAVAQIDVQTTDGARTVVRFEAADPESGGTKLGWADQKKPKELDVSFGNFLTQIERLRPVEYEPDLDAGSLTKLITIQYKRSGGDVMGTFELFRKEPAVTPELEPSEESKKANAAEYYVKTELTRVLGKVGKMSAERVTEDLPQLFGAPPKKKDPKDARGAALPGGAEKPAAEKPADNPTPAAADKPAAAGSGAAATPGKPAGQPAAKPAGSKPNPTDGNK